MTEVERKTKGKQRKQCGQCRNNRGTGNVTPGTVDDKPRCWAIVSRRKKRRLFRFLFFISSLNSCPTISELLLWLFFYVCFSGFIFKRSPSRSSLEHTPTFVRWNETTKRNEETNERTSRHQTSTTHLMNAEGKESLIQTVRIVSCRKIVIEQYFSELHYATITNEGLNYWATSCRRALWIRHVPSERYQIGDFAEGEPASFSAGNALD